jgi:hypothetical protein
VGDAGVSIGVFSDLNTTAEEMLAQGQEMFSWIANAYVKYPCTHEGFRAAQLSVQRVFFAGAGGCGLRHEIWHELLPVLAALARVVQTWLPNIRSRLNAALISAKCEKA